MLTLNLQRIFKARGIEQSYKFLVNAGFVPFIAHKYKNSKVTQIRVDHIEKLCIALNCTPNDLFEWFPDTLLDNRDDHPLHAIRQREKKIEINKMLSKLSLQRLEEVEQLIAKAGVN
jgi:DNA-binding Xre family transcriptional regulator